MNMLEETATKMVAQINAVVAANKNMSVEDISALSESLKRASDVLRRNRGPAPPPATGDTELSAEDIAHCVLSLSAPTRKSRPTVNWVLAHPPHVTVKTGNQIEVLIRPNMFLVALKKTHPDAAPESARALVNVLDRRVGALEQMGVGVQFLASGTRTVLSFDADVAELRAGLTAKKKQEVAAWTNS